MYNEKRKQEFLDTLTDKSERNRAIRTFTTSEKMEIAIDKDVGEFDRESMLDLFKYMEIGQLTTAQGCHVVIRKYCKWCIDHYLIPKRELVQISANEMQERLKELPEIITYEELQRNENLLLNICDQLILESIYLGIKGNDYCELMSMSEKDIDAVNKTIKLCTGRTVKVNDRFITLCRASAICYDYYMINGQKQALVGELPIKRNSQIDKSAGKAKNRNMIGGRMNRFKKIPEFKANLGTTMLYDSGFVNTCKESMREMQIEDFEYFLKTDRGMEIYHQYDMPISNKSRKIYKYKGYFE